MKTLPQTCDRVHLSLRRARRRSGAHDPRKRSDDAAALRRRNISMIDHYTIKLAPAANHRDIMKKLSAGETLTPEDLAKLSKVKAQLEIVGDYADMEKVRNC